MLGKLNVQHTPVSNAFRHIEPTWRNYIYYAGVAAKHGDEEMVKFIASFEALPKNEQRTIMPDAVCDLAGVSPGNLIAAVSKQVWEHYQPESAITAAINHPRMVQATAFWGQSLADCNKDRELYFRLTGGLPDKKGAAIVINNNPQNATINTQHPFANAGANGFRPMDQRVIEMSKFLDAPDDSQVMTVPLFDEDGEGVLEDTDTDED
jgi:hypothetical protein